MNNNGTLLVSAIKNGTVIDHVPAGTALKILSILGLNKEKHTITVGMNLKSKSQAKKDIIKIADWEATPDIANLIAVFAPDATINLISDYKVRKKFFVELPELIVGIAVCPNPKCVTNSETMDTIFTTLKSKTGVELRCHYCEKIFEQNEIKNYRV